MQLKCYTLILLLVVCGREAVADEPAAIVIIQNFKFTSQEITVPRGSLVRWENQEKRQYHNVWFEALDEEEPDYIFPDEFYQRVFAQVGDFPYRCGPHPKMTGIVHVIE